mgnify:CR=1 FL=1
MTDRSSTKPSQPSPDAVRRSLRALADGSAPPRDPSDACDATATSPGSIVRDAERAVRCAHEAASFLSAGRLAELDRAVARAARRGDDTVADRGRTARESLRRLDAALEGAHAPESTADPGPDRPGDDHFRSGRGTVLGDTAQRSGR